jgi:Tat protein secretion system quality control protein TatD with DNase activity
MNYHFFIDEKFVNDFVADALQIDSNQVFIAVSSRPLRFITNPAILHFKNHASELIPIVDKITKKDSMYVHWFTTPILQLIEKLPSSTNVYLMFYGGDFFESGFPPGKNSSSG